MKYVLVAGWGDKTEWNDFCIGIHDNLTIAIGHAYEYLMEFIQKEYDTRWPLHHPDNSKEYIRNNKRNIVFWEDVVCISPLYSLENDNGYLMKIEEKQNPDLKGVDLSGVDFPIDNFVRILTYDEEIFDDCKEETK